MNYSRRDFILSAGGALAAGIGGALIDPERSRAGEKRARKKGDGKVAVTWLGHGSFLFTSVEGKKILLDPWLATNPVCPGKYRYEDGRGFDKIDILLYTHGHVDHFMLPDAKMIIEKFNPLVIAPWELSFFIKSRIPSANTQTFTLGNKGSWSTFYKIRMVMVGADHSSGAQLTGFQGTNLYVGEPCGYIIEFENGYRIYHSGDTALMSSMKDIIGEFYKPDLSILPIGGVFTMGPEEAAFACKLIGSRFVIPEHYMTFPVLAKDAGHFMKSLKTEAPETGGIVINPGETTRV